MIGCVEPPGLRRISSCAGSREQGDQDRAVGALGDRHNLALGFVVPSRRRSRPWAPGLAPLENLARGGGRDHGDAEAAAPHGPRGSRRVWVGAAGECDRGRGSLRWVNAIAWSNRHVHRDATWQGSGGDRGAVVEEQRDRRLHDATAAAVVVAVEGRRHVGVELDRFGQGALVQHQRVTLGPHDRAHRAVGQEARGLDLGGAHAISTTASRSACAWTRSRRLRRARSARPSESVSPIAGRRRRARRAGRWAARPGARDRPARDQPRASTALRSRRPRAARRCPRRRRGRAPLCTRLAGR